MGYDRSPACPLCGVAPLDPGVCRPGDPARDVPELRYARCPACGHQVLTAPGASAAVYRDASYFARRDGGGAGYDDYAGERSYREAKGGRLFDWVASAGRMPPAGARVLEVGSGYGFTRRAAELRGLSTVGVDVNPAAAEGAARLYGQATVVGDLASSLRSGAVARGAFPLVVYQFVLEHLDDPVAELRLAAEALGPGGAIVLIVPSADAVELALFGGAYRSLRHDHLHLFTRASVLVALGAAGLRPVRVDSFCDRHLLADRFRREELAALYAAGLGPDLRVLAEATNAATSATVGTTLGHGRDGGL